MMFLGIAVALGSLTSAALLYLKWRLNRPPAEHNLEAAIDREVAKLLGRNVTQGIAVAVYKTGTVFLKGYGTIGTDASAVPNAETIFQLGSVSKVFTASLRPNDS